MTNIDHTYVPDGPSVWELSCDGHPREKAENDYSKRLLSQDGQDFSQTTYVAITARKWQDAATWASEKTKDAKFKRVLAYDSNNLEQWLLDTSAVGIWFAEQIGKDIKGVADVGTHWKNVLATLKRELPPNILLTNRPGTITAFANWVAGNPGPLTIRAPSPREMVDVFVAWIHTLSPEEADSVASRAIIVESDETWKALASSKQRLILVAGPNLQASPDLLAEARRQGHHVLRFARFTEIKAPDTIEMERMRVHDLAKALKNAGLGEQEADQFAEGAGGNFTVFRRRFAGNLGIERPDWADGACAQDLAPLLLAAAWTQSSISDRAAIEKLAGRPYSEIEKVANALLTVFDPPLRRVLKTWEFVSPQDAWTLLHNSLTDSLIDAFESVIVEVLGEDDPVLNVPAKDRFMASAQGIRSKYSDPLKRGLAEILSLSVGLALESVITDNHGLIGRARRIVSNLLPTGCDWKRWASVDSVLPLLAEAAPEQFLHGVARDLASPQPALLELMREESSGGFGGAGGVIYHTGLLWALEALGWSTKYTSTAAELLAKLAELDPGGKWSNRPKGSLRNLFFSWRPQTMATLDQLLTILKRLSERYPTTAWELLIGLLPEHHSAIIDSYKPSPWRSWAAGWTGEVLLTDYWRYISGVVDLALNLATADASRWAALLDRCTAWLPQDRARIFEVLEHIDPKGLGDNLRMSVWDSLRETAQKHTAFHDAVWALPAEEVKRLAEIRDRFAPQDQVELAAPLFDEGQLLYESSDVPHEQREAALHRRQEIAVAGIWNAEGVSGVLKLAKKVKLSWRVGLALAATKESEPETQIIPELLCSADKHIASFALGFGGGRMEKKGPDWAERIPTSQWTPEQIGSFACLMPFNSRSWDWVEKAGIEVKSHYWAKVRIWSAPPDAAQLERAARTLIEASRPSSAVSLLAIAKHSRKLVPSDLVFNVLEALLSAGKGGEQTLETYDVQQFIKRLQETDQIDETRLGKLEFGFLPILGKYTLRPRTLERLLARDPYFFIECLKILYRARHEIGEKETKDRGAQDSERATLLWRLLNEWKHIPGTQPDGTISGTELASWIAAARADAREVDRLEVCDIKIGEVLAHAPDGEDGVKPCIPVRQIIETCDSDEISRGFEIGLFNRRGIVSKDIFEGGQKERQLAADYKRYAEACETEWPRTAAVHRNLAQSYLREAQFADAEAEMRK